MLEEAFQLLGICLLLALLECLSGGCLGGSLRHCRQASQAVLEVHVGLIGADLVAVSAIVDAGIAGELVERDFLQQRSDVDRSVVGDAIRHLGVVGALRIKFKIK